MVVPGTGGATWNTEPALPVPAPMEVDSPGMPAPWDVDSAAGAAGAAGATAAPVGDAHADEADGDELRGRSGKRKRQTRTSSLEETPSPAVSRRSSRENTRSPSPTAEPPQLPLCVAPDLFRWSRTPELPEGYVLMPQMEDHLRSLPMDERREEMYQLGRLGMGEFTRANALVRNRALMEQLGIHQASKTIIGPAVVAKVANTGKAKKTKADATPPPRRKSSRLANGSGRKEDERADEDEGEEEGREGGDEGEEGVESEEA